MKYNVGLTNQATSEPQVGAAAAAAGAALLALTGDTPQREFLRPVI